MAVSALLELVGNDPCKADELVNAIAGLVHSFLTDRHQKGEKHAAVLRQNQDGAFEPPGDCIHKTVDAEPSSVS